MANAVNPYNPNPYSQYDQSNSINNMQHSGGQTQSIGKKETAQTEDTQEDFGVQDGFTRSEEVDDGDKIQNAQHTGLAQQSRKKGEAGTADEVDIHFGAHYEIDGEEGGDVPPADSGTVPPDGSEVPPEDGGTVPPGGSEVPPADGGTTPPEDGGTVPPGGSEVPPEDGTTPPEDGGTVPPGGSEVPPEGGTTPPEEGTTPPEDGAGETKGPGKRHPDDPGKLTDEEKAAWQEAQQNIQEWNDFMVHLAAERQKHLTEMLKYLMDIQNEIHSMMQEMAANQSKTASACARMWDDVIRGR
ncbi:MAG: hypothetical protein Q4F00_00390 [bacterium]|nr:hypothetical protein [bacterium]